MSPTATPLARHASLSVLAFRCTSRVAGRHDEPSISYVSSGSLAYRHFQGRSGLGKVVMSLVGGEGIEPPASSV